MCENTIFHNECNKLFIYKRGEWVGEGEKSAYGVTWTL